MIPKTADQKGRISLGKSFANQTVLIQEISPMEVRIIKARVVPETEAWLWQNEQALASVAKGLAQAEAGAFAPPPDLDAAEAFVEESDD
ncbi:MAG TPA: hypothetical protein VMY42_06785 [Thermoguttaceae bacterium]|nr:hypothetical protein [Thermoguttaceae bacterium]